MTLPADLDRILEEDDWLRRMARRLVGDSEGSEDLVQDAWVAALSRGRGDRPWLFGVLRNLRRESSRRELRAKELPVELPRGEESPATDDVVAELLLRKRVTASLLELPEPYRTALFLRFVQDEKLPAIARRMDVALSTLHQRIHRGLELLRVRLDEHYGGDRQSWALGLLSLAEPLRSAAGLVGGGILMGASAKVIAALLVVSGGVAWVWNSASDENAAGVLLAEERAPALEQEAPAPLVTLDRSGVSREAVEAKPVASEPTESVAASTATEWRGRVVDLEGQAVAGVTIALESASGPGASVTTSSSGAFTLSGELEADHGPRFVCRDEDWLTLLPGLPSNSEYIVVVGLAADFAGVVVDEGGAPVANAELRVGLRQSLYRDLAIARSFTGRDFERTVRTNAAGRFELSRLPGGERMGLWVTAKGYSTESVTLPVQGDSAMRIVLTDPTDERVLRGYVLDSAGLAVEGASVSAGREIVLTNAEGAFELAVEFDPEPRFAGHADGSFSPAGNAGVLRAAYPGALPAERLLEELEADREIVLYLGQESLTIRGRIVDESGAPRKDVIVWVSDLTPFGSESNDTGEARAVWNISLEELNNESRVGCGTLTATDGGFALTGLLEREYELRAYDTATATQAGPWKLMAGSTGVERVLASEPGTTRVAGRVVSMSGVPLANTWIVPRRSAKFDDVTQPPQLSQAPLGTRTDEEGRFEFPALATEGTVLELQHELFFIRHYPLEKLPELDQLEIVQPVLCDLQVELTWDPELADTLEVRDRYGEPIEVLESYGAFLATGKTGRIVGGKTSVLSVLETGSTLVLFKNGVEVLRENIRLDPTELNLVQL